MNLPAGGFRSPSVATGTLPPSATAALTNTARIDPPPAVPDPVLANNSDDDTNPTTSEADLRVTKAGTPNPFVPGAPLTYTIVATNAGPSDVAGARVQDPLPPAFASFTWTCTLSTGASCAIPSGTGDIDVLLDLPAGVSATIHEHGDGALELCRQRRTTR